MSNIQQVFSGRKFGSKQYITRPNAGPGFSFEKGDSVFRVKGPSGKKTPLLIQKQNKLLNSLLRIEALVSKYPFLAGVDLIARKPKIKDVSALDVSNNADADKLSEYILAQGQAVQTLTDFPEVLEAWANLKIGQSSESKVSLMFQELGLGVKEFAVFEKQRHLAEAANTKFKEFMSQPGNSPASILKAIADRDAALNVAFAELNVLSCLYVTFSDLPAKVKAKLVKAGKTKEEIASARDKILKDFKIEACKAYLAGEVDKSSPFHYSTWLDNYSKG